MNVDEVLEWTMGWPWPVIVLLCVLIAWGIGRVLTWDEEGQKNEQVRGTTAADEACVCTCR